RSPTPTRRCSRSASTACYRHKDQELKPKLLMKSKIIIRLENHLPALLMAALACPWPAEAATLLVYNNNDAGAGSLRQALQDNAALGAGNTIIFSNTVTGTITLGSELSISAGVTILGPSAKVLTISGNNSTRVFDITSGTNSISGLTIANGYMLLANGPGIQNAGASLTIQNCVFSNNSCPGGGGGGLFSQSPATILNSTFQ